MSAPTFLDLFCGCGGFSLGMERAGFRCLAAIDFNEEAVATYKGHTLTSGQVTQTPRPRFQSREKPGHPAGLL